MKKSNLVDEWIEKAEGDYLAAIYLRAKRRINQNYIIAFHCQQCLEKYLKALLTFYRIAFPKLHDLEALVELLTKKDPLLKAIKGPLGEITPYAVDSRYPGDEVTTQEVSFAMKTMKQIRPILRKRLGLKP